VSAYADTLHMRITKEAAQRSAETDLWAQAQKG